MIKQCVSSQIYKNSHMIQLLMWDIWDEVEEEEEEKFKEYPYHVSVRKYLSSLAEVVQILT